MKQLFKAIRSFTTFNRTERNGLLLLCGLLILLLVVRATMSLWVHPSFDKEQEAKLVAAWKTFKHISDSTAQKQSEYTDTDDNNVVLPDTIDINTADSATLVKLKGIGPATARWIVETRQEDGPFTNLDELWETGYISEKNIEVLKKHLRAIPPKQPQ